MLYNHHQCECVFVFVKSAKTWQRATDMIWWERGGREEERRSYFRCTHTALKPTGKRFASVCYFRGVFWRCVWVGGEVGRLEKRKNKGKEKRKYLLLFAGDVITCNIIIIVAVCSVYPEASNHQHMKRTEEKRKSKEKNRKQTRCVCVYCHFWTY